MPFPIDLARQMIAIDSVTSRGTADLARFCAGLLLARTDLNVSLWEGESPNQVNLVATRALPEQPSVLLNSHLDTVPPGDFALWTRCGGNPFAATVAGEGLCGLGVADAKLDWLCKTLALERLRERPLSRGVLFAGTFGEESGLRGARALLSRLPQRPAAAWAGEPTELSLVTRHKGLLVVTVIGRAGKPAGSEATCRVTVLGRSAHSSHPELGDNAILRALRLVRDRRLRIAALHGGDAANKVPAHCVLDLAPDAARQAISGYNWAEGSAEPLAGGLDALLFDVVAEAEQIASSSVVEDPSFSPPTLTWNLGKVEAEGGEVRVTLDFRFLPGDDAGRIIDRLERLLARERRERQIEATLAIERNNPPLDTASDALPVAWSLAALAESGLSTELRTKSGCTEAGLYSAAGIPSVVFGPGRAAGNIHAPNEWISIPDLERAVEFYALLLTKVCVS